VRHVGVCLDALCALREVAGGGIADLLQVATLLDVAGCDTVQLGVTEDLRPVSEADVRDAARGATCELRIAPAPGLVKLALEARPARVLLASESREHALRAIPLDFRAWGGALAPAVRSLREAGLRVDALVTPDLDAVKAAHQADVAGVDLYTGASLDLPLEARAAALQGLGDAARLAAKLRLHVGVSGGIDLRAVRDLIDAAPVVARLTVGRAFLGRALLRGVEAALRDLRAAAD